MSKHQKHTALVKPEEGEFGRNEIAIMGTPCGNIKKIVRQLVSDLKPLHIAYIDADHKSGDDQQDPNVSLTHGAMKEYTDKIHYNQVNFTGEFNKYQRKKYFQNTDLVVVNGNHFTAQKQILVLDPKKDLSKKLDRITNVAAILKKDFDGDVPQFLKDHLGEKVQAIPVWDFSDTTKIVSLLKGMIGENTPPVYGLLLGGGQSTRMKTDKGELNYHGKPQREYATDLLDGITKSTYFSCRADQAEDLPKNLQPLTDTFEGLGPFGGILSAFRYNPNVAWLSIAIDLPLLDRELLDYLIEHRNPSKLATAFLDPKEAFPEPLITIWEPRAYPEMLYFLSQGYSCPRKVLINSDIELLKAPDPKKLTNVNEPWEFEEVKGMLTRT